MPTFKSNHKPIRSVKSLAFALSVPQKHLLETSNIAEQLYRESNNPKLYKNGKKRIAYNVLDPLKSVQEKIKKRFFHKADFPAFLQGGIKNKQVVRNYVQNATIHCGARILIIEDIQSYFPSIKAEEILKLWRYFYNFSDEVSEILTKLTVYEGKLPQGSSTSSYLANLLFWDLEPFLEEKLSLRGIKYTRFIDDIAISSEKHLSRSQIESIKQEVHSMFRKKGLSPSYKKSRTSTGRTRMKVNGLNINSGKPTIEKNKRNLIRLLLYNLERQFTECGFIEEKELQSVMGKIHNAFQLHPTRMKKYLAEIKNLEERSRLQNRLI